MHVGDMDDAIAYGRFLSTAMRAAAWEV